MWSLLGIVLSAAWLAVAWWWVDREIGFENASYLLLPEVAGQYLAALMAPLILIWVLMGYLRGPRGLSRLRGELADLRAELSERERREAALAAREAARPAPVPTPTLAPAPLVNPATGAMPAPRRQAEPVAPLVVPPAAPPVAAPPPREPPPREAPPQMPHPHPALASAPLAHPAPPRAASLVAAPLAPAPAAPPAAPAPDSGATVTSIAQEVARSLGRLPPEPVAAAPLALTNALDPDPVLDEEFRQLIHKVGRDLNAICMDLSAVLCRKSARDEALKAYNRGHKEAFHVLVRDYLSRHAPAEIMTRLAQADAQSLLHTYAMKFASLIDEAVRRDPSGTQEQALRHSAMGQLYEEVQRHTQVARGGGRA